MVVLASVAALVPEVNVLGLVRLPAFQLPVTDLLTRVAGGVLCWAVLSTWSVALCAVAI